MRVLLLVFTFCVAVFGQEKPPQPPNKEEQKKQERDEVELKDGRVLRGWVVDTGGPTILLRGKHGSITLLKKDIKRIHFAQERKEVLQNDRVFRKDGTVVVGQVSVDPEKRVVVVTKRTKSGKVKVVIPYDEVQKIEKAAEAVRGKFWKRVEELLAKLCAGNEKEQKAAEKQLIKMGVFAEEPLKTLRFKQPVRVQKVIDRVLKICDLNRYLTPRMMEEVKDIHKRLMSNNPQVKIEVLKELMLGYMDAVIPLLKFLVSHPSEDALVRGYCLAALARLGRYHDVAELLKSEDGRLRFAAAAALADAGIYLGLPQLMSGLRMKEVRVRRMALERLKKIAGSDFGYDPQKGLEKQQAALQKWQKWYEANKERIIREASKKLMPQTVTEDEKLFARAKVEEGYELWRQGRLAEALAAFQRAAEIDPGCVKAQLAATIIAYSVDKNFKKARKHLMRLLLMPERLTEETRREIRYQLGQMALDVGDWKEALHQFRATLFADAAYGPAYEGLARAYLLCLKKGRADDEGGVEVVARKALDAARISLAYIDSELANITNADFLAKVRELRKEVVLRSGRHTKLRTDEDVAAYEDTLKAAKASILCVIADVYAQLKRYDDAAGALGDACRLRPKDAWLHYRLGVALLMTGDKAGAKKALKTACRLAPKERLFKETLQALEQQK